MITVIGTGYVGLVQGACLADLGNEAICVDVDADKIERLKKGEMPIYEPGLSDIVQLNVAQHRLRFTTDVDAAIKAADIIFICVGTPPKESGEANMQYIYKAAETIGKNLNSYKIIITKSTVPVGTGDAIKKIIKENLVKDVEFDIVSNPEFLREGAAVKDFQNPDRIIIGVESEKAQERIGKLYRSLERTGKPIMYTDIKSAELIKYASNAMLATRLSFMNMLSQLTEKVGGDIKQVARGIGLDDRIGPRYLQAGVGYGGSCFPKDVLELQHTLEKNGCDAQLIEAVHTTNENQKRSIVPKVKKLIGKLTGKKIAIWGLSFKPRTDDMRMAPAIEIIKQLEQEGAEVHAYDPVAMENAKKILPNITYHDDPYSAVDGAHCIVLVTEWDVFRELDFEKVKELMKTPNLIDGRNIYGPAYMQEQGFTYRGIGR